MKRVLFIDRDGTLINEAPPTYQIDSFDKLSFYPHMFEYMGRISRELDYELVMITNQDGLGSTSFPENTFWPLHEFVMKSLEGEGIQFNNVLIDRTLASENAYTRKPNIGLVVPYLNNDQYDIQNSYVIGDRITDVQLAKNLGCKAIWLNNDPELGSAEISDKVNQLKSVVALETTEWKDVYQFRSEEHTSELQSRLHLVCRLLLE